MNRVAFHGVPRLDIKDARDVGTSGQMTNAHRRRIDMKIIALTQGQVTRVDDEWFEFLNQWKWYALYNPGTKSFYAGRKSPTLFGKRKTVYMHRVIANTPDGVQVDHRDHDTLNNQGRNLRICTNAQNNQNREKPNNNTSGYKGVVWRKERRKWNAKIQFNNEEIHLGYFDDPEEAARAYDEAARKYFGEFSVLNFPESG